MTNVQIEASRKALLSNLFLICQPNRSDVFSFVNNHASEILEHVFEAAAEEVQGLANPEATKPLHTDDIAVDEFAAMMKEKLEQARLKGSWGWETCSELDLLKMLDEHVHRGDMRDIAIIAMMIHLNRRRTPPTAEDLNFAAEVLWMVTQGELASGDSEFVSKLKKISSHLKQQAREQSLTI